MDRTTNARQYTASRLRAPRAAGQPPADWLAQAVEHEDAGRFHQAMRCYQRAIETTGESPELLFNLANVLYRLRRKVEAVGQYRRAVELDPGMHDAWNNLGVALCELRECDQAAWSFQQAIRLAPWCGDALFNLADCLTERGETATAEPYWRDYLRLDPGSEWGDYAQQNIARGDRS